jgi:hypothetical protein
VSEPPIHVSGDDAQAQPQKTGHRLLDITIAISAIFISAVSLFVAVENGRTQRDLVAASSWPILREILSNGYNDKGDIAIGFSNGGVGPAEVKSFEVFYKGAPVSSGLDLLHRCCGLRAGAAAVGEQLPEHFLYSIADETVLRPGENNAVIQVKRSAAAPEVPLRFSAALSFITFRACYCSVLGECWISDLRSTRTTPVKKCLPPSHRFDPNGQ